MNIEKIKTTNKLKGPVPDLKRFWDKVNIVDDKLSCWNWIGSKDGDGYGKIGVERKGFRKTFKAHRLSFELQNGPIPDGHCICHRCDNPSCVRPNHLELGTVWDNNHDKEKKNRDARGERNGSAKLDESTILEIREIYRMGHYSQRQLGAIYGISQSAISKIISGKRWLHVGEYESFFKEEKARGMVDSDEQRKR